MTIETIETIEIADDASEQEIKEQLLDLLKEELGAGWDYLPGELKSELKRLSFFCIFEDPKNKKIKLIDNECIKKLAHKILELALKIKEEKQMIIELECQILRDCEREKKQNVLYTQTQTQFLERTIETYKENITLIAEDVHYYLKREKKQNDLYTHTQNNDLYGGIKR